MPIDQRGLLLRTAAALRRAAAALARRARDSAPGSGGETPPASGSGGETPPASPAAGEDQAAFLEHVRDTLLDLSAGPAEAPPEPAPRARRAVDGLRAGLKRFAALLEPARRHEDVVLALALLVGIAVMILHWVR